MDTLALEKKVKKYFYPNLTLNISDLQPAPRVGFNLTFVCPEGQVFNSQKSKVKQSPKKVFDHDWFATPFVLTTCQPNGAFDSPDWSTFACVLRKLFLIKGLAEIVIGSIRERFIRSCVSF